MLIGQLSKKTGLSRDTIRFYEKKGLIPKGIQENEFNNYKNYPVETLEKLQVIKRMKGLGLTLNEIAGFLELLNSNAASCQNVSQKMNKKVKLIDEKIKHLRAMKKRITDRLDSCPVQENVAENCPMILVDL